MTTEPELTPEQIQQIQSEQAFMQPVMLPLRYDVGSVQGQDGSPLIVLATQTPASTQRIVLTRNDALELASAIRKQADKGPMLVSPPPGFVVPR